MVGAGHVGGKKGTKGRERDALRKARHAARGFYFGAGRYSADFANAGASGRASRGGRERTGRMNERAGERERPQYRARYPSRTDTGPRTRSKANIHEMTRRRRGSARVVLPPPSSFPFPFPRDEKRTRVDSREAERGKIRGGRSRQRGGGIAQGNKGKRQTEFAETRAFYLKRYTNPPVLPSASPPFPRPDRNNLTQPRVNIATDP